ncbi:amino acid ABC transporter permease [uncultured Treponema sp.]|uniref:amino acid ABC transporter permease n=1 Tax=uncultured Treponema sp. TaxID=162155 RepID=UPI0025D1018A|nr:amino acid ABC transporter permease [uncultured Treponema sp.]
MTSIQKIIGWIPALLDGAKITILLTLTSVAAGIVIGLFLSLGKMSKDKFLKKICSVYIFFFRGTPLLMQLYFLYFGLPKLFPVLTLRNKFLAAFIAFGLNSGAYMAEYIRAAIQSIDKGQKEASHALGFSYAQTMGLIIVPQSIRRLIPAIGNEFIMVLKDASLVSLIALEDITKVTRSIASSSGNELVYIPAMILYLIITAVFSVVFNRTEKRFSVYE